MAKETMRDMLAGITYDKEPRPKLIANNTVQYYRDGQKIIRLHSTDIMVYSKDGKTVKLYTGGWLTVTTKDRLNRFSPGRGAIFSDRGTWYMTRGVPFFEGIELNCETGAIEHLAQAARKAARVGAEQKTLAKRIEGFVKKVHGLSELPHPDAGDCWLCSMFERVEPVANGYGPGNRTGQKISNPDHLLSHIKEGYLHGSLIVNAMRWAGYKDEGIGLYFDMHKRDKASGHYHGRHSTVARSLRRFLRSQLGLAT
jgi:hypothetical protein